MAGQALHWNNPSMDLERFQKPSMPLRAHSFGFQGYPSGFMEQYKPPVRVQASADVTRDVDRYFRRDSANDRDRLPSPVKQAPPPQQEEDKRPPPPLKLDEDRQKPHWLQDKGTSRLQGSDSPRLENGYNSSRDFVIRDPYRDLSSAERERRKREFQIAQEDLAEAARRKKEREEERKEDIRKIRELQENYRPYGQPGGGAPTNDHRKQKFTEHQLVKPGSPKYNEPPRPRYDGVMTERETPSRLLREQDLKMDRVRHSLDQVRNGYPEDRREELLRDQEREIDDLRRKLSLLEKGRQDTAKDRRLSEGVNQQDLALKKLQDDIDQLKREVNPEMRAQSEPPTDRYTNYRQQRGRDFYESTNPYGLSKSPQLAGYLNTTPRRPVGRWYNDKSTYKQDFDEPFFRRGRRVLGNPNKGEYDQWDPFGVPGGGAPRVDATGQRTTQIQRSMGVLGREHADSAKRKKQQNKELLYTIGEQAAYERMKKQAEKEYMQEGSIELAEHMRGPYMKVGYPGGKPNHHLPHSVSNPNVPPPIAQQRQYHHDLEHQINERNKQVQLSKLDDAHKANLHFVEMDKRFKHDNYGGGAPKGLDYRKVKLDNAIHNPTDTPYWTLGRI